MSELLALARAEKATIADAQMAAMRAQERRCACAREKFIDLLRINAFPWSEVYSTGYTLSAQEQSCGPEYEHTVTLAVHQPGGRVEVEGYWGLIGRSVTVRVVTSQGKELSQVRSSWKAARIDFLAGCNLLEDAREAAARNPAF